MRNLAAVAALAFGALFALAASATINHGDFAGTNVTFNDVTETSNSGDPEPFGAPTGVAGDSLLFSPTTYAATTSGINGYDENFGLLQTVIEATALNATIDVLNFKEFGDATLLGALNANTGVYAALAGYVRVLEVNGAPVAPFNIGFNAGALVPINGSFSPVALGDAGPGLNRVSNPGTTLWSGTVSVNVAAELLLHGYLPADGATKVELVLDNNLYAYTSPDGGSARVQKKLVDGPSIIIEVIPEPGTFALVCGGLLALSLRARGRRA